MKKANIFYSYSHKDEALRDKLEAHLSMLKHQEYIENWYDRCIKVGSNINEEIDKNLEKADIILLLVSSNFISSDYCYNKEMKKALQLSEEKKSVVIPIILRACDWHSAPFGKLLGLPKDGKPVTSWRNEDEAWTDIARSLRKVIENK